MIVKEFNTNNWSELDPQYQPDMDFVTKKQKVYSDSCLVFSFPQFLKSNYDQKTNNFSTLALTSSLQISDAFQIDTPESIGNGFVTVISNGIDSITNTAQRYWLAIPSSSKKYLEIDTNNSFGEKNPDFYFEIDFLNDNTCRVSHNYYNIKYYLNFNLLSNQVVFLSADNDIFSPNTLEKQKFEYIFDQANKLIAFFYRKNNNVYTLTKIASSLSFSPLTGSNIQFTENNVFNLHPIKFTLLDSVSSFWFEYTKQYDTNNLNVNCSVTEKDSNQLVFHTEYNNINSVEMPFNIINQKTSLTPSSNNISSADSKKQRNYVSLNTGSNQQTGNIKFSTNYQSSINEYSFLPGKITYFHTPVQMGPHQMININDTNLVESGSIFSNTPEFSDKVWKKMSNYSLTSKFGDPLGEVNGTWLCSWLSGSSDPNILPVWYDRYFIPNKTTRESAFSASNVYTYTSHYDCVTNQSNSNNEIFDVFSNLTFDPYALYAYYRTGKNDILNLKKQNANNLLFEQINQYFDVKGTILTTENGNYSFFGNQYGLCETINSKSFNNQFTILFSLFSRDFSEPFGHQLIGNYKNRGLGIYSDRSVTPFLRIIKDKSILIYDTKMNQIDQVNFQNQIIQIVQLESLDDYFVLDNQGELFQLDSKNTIFDSTFFGPLSTTISHVSDDFYTHFLVSSAGDVVSYNRNTEDITYNTFSRVFSVSPMTNAGDLKKIGNNLYVIDGKNAQKYDEYRIFYIKNGEIVEWNISSNNIETRMFNSSGTILTYKLDENNNFYIFDNNSTCYVHNSAGFIVTTLQMPISSSTVIASDYSKIYSNGQKIETVYAVCSSANSNLVVGINPEKISVFDSIIYSFDYNLSGVRYSGFSNSNYNKEFLDLNYPSHTISVRLGLPNLYAYNSFDEINLKFNATQLNYGYHEFALSVDSIEGIAKLIVNGNIVDTKNINPGKYTFSNIITEPLSFGSTQYFAGTELFQTLNKIQNAFLVGNVVMRDVFFFTKPLNYYEIRLLQKLSKDIKPINFILPSETRNYTETVQQFFRQRVPYHKSPFVDISINNSKILNEQARNYIQENLNLILMNNLPYYTKISNLIWRENL